MALTFICSLLCHILALLNSTYITWWLILPDDVGDGVRKINMSSLKARNFIPKAKFCIPHPVKTRNFIPESLIFVKIGDLLGHCRWKKYTNPRFWRKVYEFSYLGLWKTS